MRFRFAVICLLWISLLFSTSRSEEPYTLGITLRHTQNGQPLQLDSFRYATAANESYSVTRLSYLLSDFELQDASGTWIPTAERFAYIDVEKRRESFVLTEIARGRFRALRFAVGIDPETNHRDPSAYPAEHPLNPNHNQLHWDWKTGYIFLALEGRYRKPDGTLSGFVYHIANNPQRTLITLPLPQDLTSTSALEIDFDLAALLNSPHPISFAADGASTHSHAGDPLSAAIAANLPTAFQVRRMVSFTAKETIETQTPIDLPDVFTPHPFRMNARFPVPALPMDNPLITERLTLGEYLFHDKGLSANDTISCSSCHKQPHALSDTLKQSVGIHGQKSRRHSMPLFNLAWKEEFFWDGRAPSLRAQVLMPIEDPTEMGSSLTQVVEKLSADPDYPKQFESAFATGDITAEHIALALEAFLLAQTSTTSTFDQAMQGKGSLNEQEQRGLKLFMTEFEPRSKQYGADCFHCHGGALFTDHRFHDNGLVKKVDDRGRAEVTGNPADENHFATPSLRNVALTAPYMHDGRFNTLEEVVEHYSSGITQRDTLDPNLAKHPQGGLQLSTADKAALVAFLKTLSDPAYGNPDTRSVESGGPDGDPLK